MQTILYALIVISSLSNMVADILLSAGQDYRNPQQTTLDKVRNTPEKNLLISAVLGFLSIACWQAVLLALQDLSGVVGSIAKVSFAIYIATIMVFHVVCCLAIHLCKVNESKEKIATKYLIFFGVLCFVFSLLYSVAMIVLSVRGELQMAWYHYLGLPFFSVMIIQFIAGRILAKVPYYSSISGTLSMMLSLLLTVHLMAKNSLF